MRIIALIAAAFAFAAHAQTFRLESPDIRPGAPIAEEQVYNGSGCTGANLSPALSWSAAPAGTRSFALLVHDPDTPTGGAGWWHWAVIDIPLGVTRLPKDAGKADGSRLPKGARQIPNDFEVAGWGGPCPPPGDKPHRYNFTVYALKAAKLDLPDNATAAAAAPVVNANALARATLTARYSRRK